jgi:hypothetical protein
VDQSIVSSEVGSHFGGYGAGLSNKDGSVTLNDCTITGFLQCLQ